eukprot:2880871-Amphidinium_carterae.1
MDVDGLGVDFDAQEETCNAWLANFRLIHGQTQHFRVPGWPATQVKGKYTGRQYSISSLRANAPDL